MVLLTLEIIKREKAATDAIILCFKELNGLPIAYEAGQFFTFIVEIHGRELRRSYSIVSTPGIDRDPAVVIKRQVNGEVSRYIIDHYQAGDRITALVPSGRFTINLPEAANRKIFFIAAGSGISPVFSLIKKILYEAPSCSVMLIYQNRDEPSVIFQKELESLAAIFPARFSLVILLSAPPDDLSRSQRLNNNLLEDLLLKEKGFTAERSLFYICGPGAFMRMCHFVLKLIAVPDEHIRQEQYVVDFFPAPPFMTDHSHKKINIDFEGKKHQFVIRYPENILQGALTHHLKLPYSCRGGKCSTCIARCISGKVKMSINQVLTEKDLEAGWILTCVSYAETDVELVC